MAALDCAVEGCSGGQITAMVFSSTGFDDIATSATAMDLPRVVKQVLRHTSVGWTLSLRQLPRGAVVLVAVENEDSDRPSAELAEVEGRIADAMRGFALQSVSPRQSRHRTLPPYIRRHIVEHAEAGGILGGVVVPELVPWLDIASLREAHPDNPIPLLALARKTSYAWNFGDPGQNAAALAFASTAEGRPIEGLPTAWSVLWAKAPGPSEIVVAGGATVVDLVRTSTGRAYAAFAGPDGVKVRDLRSTTGVPVAVKIRRPTAIAVVAVEEEHRLILALGDEDGAVTLVPIPLDGDGQLRFPERQLPGAVGGGYEVTRILGYTGERTEFVVGKADGSVSIVAADGTGVARRLRRRRADESKIAGVAVDTERGRGYSLAGDGSLGAWELSAPRAGVVEMTNAGEDPRAVAYTTVHGEPLVLAVADGQLKRWRLTLNADPELIPHDAPVTAVAVPAGSDLPIAVTGDALGRVRVLRLDQDSVGRPFAGHSGEVTGLACTTEASGGVTAVSVGADRSVRSWRLLLGDLVAPDGEHRAASDLQTRKVEPVDRSRPLLRVWDVTDGREVGVDLPTHTHRFSSVAVVAQADRPPVAFSIDAAGLDSRRVGTPRVVTAALRSGQLVVAATNGHGVRLWNLASAADGVRAARPIPDPFRDDPVVDLTAVTDRDGTVVLAVAGLDGALRFWDLEGSRLIGKHTAVDVTALAATTAPDGRSYFVAACGDTSLRVWDAAATDEPPSLVRRSAERKDRRKVLALAVAHVDGRLVAVTARHGEARLRRWLLGSEDVADIPGSDGRVTALALSTATERPTVVVAGEDRLLHAVDLDSGRPVAGSSMPLPGVIRAVSCLPHEPAAVIAGDDVFARVQWGPR